MITRGDDYPIHQTAEPIARRRRRRPQLLRPLLLQRLRARRQRLPRRGDGQYPNRQVVDAAFNVVHRGRQYVVRASRHAGRRPHGDPGRADRRRGARAAALAAPDRAAERSGTITADLVFTARCAADRGAALPPRARRARLHGLDPAHPARRDQRHDHRRRRAHRGHARSATGARATAPGASGRSASATPTRRRRRPSSSGSGRRSTSTTSAPTSTSTRRPTARAGTRPA